MFKHRKKKYGTVSSKRSIKSFIFSSLLILALGLFLTGIIYFIFYSDFFLIRKIEVTGTRLASPIVVRSEIISELVAQKPWRSIFGPAHAFFWIGVQKINLSKINPLISYVSASFNPREHQVTIKIKERQVWAVICSKNYNCFAVDKTGTVFIKTPEIIGFLILKIIDSNNLEPKLGAPLFSDDKMVSNIINTVEEIKKADLYPREIEIKNHSLREWAVQTSTGLSLLFSFDFKPMNLSAVIKELSKVKSLNSILTLDFRVPEKIYYISR